MISSSMYLTSGISAWMFSSSRSTSSPKNSISASPCILRYSSSSAVVPACHVARTTDETVAHRCRSGKERAYLLQCAELFDHIAALCMVASGDLCAIKLELGLEADTISSECRCFDLMHRAIVIPPASERARERERVSIMISIESAPTNERPCV